MFGIWNSLDDLGDCSSIAPQITATALQYGIDPNVAYNQLQQESGCNPFAVSPRGAVGIAQFIPSTWLEWGSSNPADRTNVQASLDAWGAYFRDLLDTNGGDYSLALAAYNAGQSRVDYYGGVPPFQETQNYVAKILGSLGLSSPGAGSSGSVSAGSSFTIAGGDQTAAGIGGVTLIAAALLLFALSR